jgi:ribosomal protein S3AE
MVLGKMGSDIFNRVKKILIPRHVGVYKSKVVRLPEWVYEGRKPEEQVEQAPAS